MLQLTESGLLYAPSGVSIADTSIGADDFEAFVARIGRGNIAGAKAVLEVEAAGRGFTTSMGVRVPKILFEAHIMYRESGKWKVRGEAPHLSAPRWDKSLYSRLGIKRKPGEDMQHARLREAVELDDRLGAGGEVRAAALRSCSWGIGQVMGFHAEALGYGDVQRFVTAMYAGEDSQFEAVARFIVSNGLSRAFGNLGRAAAQCAPFASGYNGLGYRANNYHGLLARAYVRHGGR